MQNSENVNLIGQEISQTTNHEDSDKIIYQRLGFHAASSSHAIPSTMIHCLDDFYGTFLKERKQGLKARITQLKDEILQEKTKINNANAQIAKNNEILLMKNAEITKLNEARKEAKSSTHETGDTTPFIIGAFITILLTLYLFVFYSSSGYSAFYGVKPGSLGFINPNIFSDAVNKGGGVIALIILFPVIFLGLGFLIHDSIEKNKKFKANNEPRNYKIIIALIFVAFIADAFIGYKISQGIHDNQFNAGLTDKLWHFSMIFSDINFYLVLILGFVMYVIWGFLLNYVLSHPYLKTQDEKTKLKLHEIDTNLKSLKQESSDLNSKNHELTHQVKNYEDAISKKQHTINDYEKGEHIPVSISDLKGSVGQFMTGYITFVTNYYGKIEAGNVLLEITSIKEKWLTNTIENLEQQNLNTEN